MSILSFAMQAQDQYQTVQKGSTFPFSLKISTSNIMVIDNPVSGNTLEQVDQVGDIYYFEYTPAEDFTGADGFTLQEYNPFPPINQKNYTFVINVVESMVELGDDFVRLTSDQTVTIDPTANDSSTASDLEIEIAQVMYGAAVLNDDNTITYTPSDSDLDYIVYSGKDMYGSSSTATIYISTEGEQPSENTADSYDVASGSYEYITLPWTDYISDSDSIDFGTLTQINDFVWKYNSNESVSGVEEISFVTDSGLEHTVSINVIEKYVDGGFVKDDIFFSAKNTQLIFNVKDNDINGQTVIDSYSDELFHIGDGAFAFTPEPGEAGVYEFEYSATTGTETESGSIKIVVGNLTPSSSADYTLSTPKNQPRVISYDVPLGTEFFEIESYPSHGTLEVFGNDESVDVGCDDGVQKMFALYTPNQDFVGADDITLRYFASDNNLPTYSTIVLITEDTDVDDACICVDDCVWPGDANGDGNVNMRDLLAIGRYMGASGDVRETSPFGEAYEGVQVPDWNGNQINGKSIGYADANGDGIVTMDDINIVADNYNDVNTLVSNDLFGVKDIPFYMVSNTDTEVGEVKEIEIYAGTTSYPAVDMRGIAFTVNLPAENVDVSSINMEFAEDNFFVRNAPYADMTYVTPDAVVVSGGVKTNGIGSTGSGLIGVLSFIIIEDAEGIRPSGRNSASNNNFKVELADIVFEANDGLQYAIPGSSMSFSIKDENEVYNQSVEVYPNPALNEAVVSTANGTNISNISIVNITGETIATYNNINAKTSTLNISNLKSGMYILNVTSSKGTESVKMIKS